MKPSGPNLLSGSPLSPSGTAPPKGEHLTALLHLPLLLILAACAPKTDVPAAVTLDCAQGYDALKAKIAAQPGVAAAPKEEGEPYRAYSTADGKASWFVTEPGAPAHPAILMQQATPQGMKDTGCAFGDQAAYGELQTYLKSLAAARK